MLEEGNAVGTDAVEDLLRYLVLPEPEPPAIPMTSGSGCLMRKIIPLQGREFANYDCCVVGRAGRAGGLAILKFKEFHHGATQTRSLHSESAP